jgi:hypothetical protein
MIENYIKSNSCKEERVLYNLNQKYFINEVIHIVKVVNVERGNSLCRQTTTKI